MVIIRINVYFICLHIYFGIRGEKITILTMNRNILAVDSQHRGIDDSEEKNKKVIELCIMHTRNYYVYYFLSSVTYMITIYIATLSNYYET